jgi:hypothetical protein
MIKTLIGLVIILVSVIVIGYLVANYFDKSEVVERAMEEAEESESEIQQTLVECRNVLANAGIDPVACDRRAEQARQQIIKSLKQ